MPARIHNLYCDFETSSNDPDEKSVDPWDRVHCRVIGAALAFDDGPVHFVTREQLLHGDWFECVLSRAESWVNHNVKYDYHVACNDLRVEYHGELVDTLTLAKIIDSDRTYKGGYGLKDLSRDLLQDDISEFGDRMAPYLENNKDFGRVPLDILADYACQDVVSNRKLYAFLLSKLHTECNNVWNTERALTRVLVDIEDRGLNIDATEVKIELARVYHRMMQIDEDLYERLGYRVNPTSTTDCYDLIVNRFGMPVIAWTEGDEDDDPDERGNPSFRKEALAQYLMMRDAPIEVLSLLVEYRKLSTRRGLFLEPWLNLHHDGVLHSDYNQSVRSGRMSCRNPNAQQLDGRVKKLIHPSPGYSILSCDYSQIEYRLIVHYTQDPRGIKAYNEDPNIDYHQWVADILGCKRRPAKTINFMLGFGGGKRKTTRTLAAMADLDMHGDTPEVAASKLYNNYHANLPGLRRTSSYAESVARSRGYVRNIAGRHLHLPLTRAHVGFNRIVQSSAADIMKERAVALHAECESLGCRIIGLVHDDFVIEVPTEHLVETAGRVNRIIEGTPFPVRVPITANPKASDHSWGDAVKLSEYIDRSVQPVG